MPDTPADHAPAPSHRAHPAGLPPAPATAFLGRAAELAEVVDLLGRTRLLTLAGPGGAGKTRLAVACAESVAASRPDGVCFVELAPVTDPVMVAAAVVAALGLDVAAPPGPLLEQQLHVGLSDRRLLLVLDNCEHLVEAVAAFVATLLRRCPHVRVLATSREVLGVAGETAWPIPPLGLPPESVAAPDALGEFGAVALFCERARAAQPSFRLDETNAAAVARICWRLDGIPLAIELAAARLRVLSARQIADRLDDRFALLRGNAPGVETRHRTLRAAMDWSDELLAEPERIVLRRLAVFGSTFDLAAAEAVAGRPETHPCDVLDLVSRLVDKSLVAVAPSGETARYRLLETVREYYLERLAESGELGPTRMRHAAHFAGLARDWLGRDGDLWWTVDGWAARATEEEHNFRTALLVGVEDGDADAVVHIAAALWMHWLFCSRLEARAWLEWAVAATAGRSGRARQFALVGLAFFLVFGEDVDLERSTATLQTALREALDSDDALMVGSAYYAIAESALARRDLAAAHAAGRAGLAAWAARGSVLASYSERLLGWVCLARGERADAVAHFERSLAIGWECDVATAHSAAALAPHLARDGDALRARSLADEAIVRARRLGWTTVEAMALVAATTTRVLVGDARHARDLAVELLALLVRTGGRSYLADAAELAALLLVDAGRDEAAAGLVGMCERIRGARAEHGPSHLAVECAAARERGRARLGATAWDAAAGRGALTPLSSGVAQARDALREVPAAPPAADASLRREGALWSVRHGTALARLRHVKGLADLAVLVARPGVDVHVLDLASPDPALARTASAAAPVLDQRALAAYRARLAQIDEDEKRAAHRRDEAGLVRLDLERAALQTELRVAAGLGGRVRPLGGEAAERARKAVAARLRDAVGRIAAELPELGAHLDRSLVTGLYCRYQPREPLSWDPTLLGD
ncbi:MAG: ATP-binding protein [Sporichthyaceae bacterium]